MRQSKLKMVRKMAESVGTMVEQEKDPVAIVDKISSVVDTIEGMLNKLAREVDLSALQAWSNNDGHMLANSFKEFQTAFRDMQTSSTVASRSASKSR